MRAMETLPTNDPPYVGRGDRVDWWCRGCVLAVAKKAAGATPHSRLDMNPKPQKKGA
jgi:hypothetical protein